jgi:collagenase-like PrtC family protease
MDSLFSVGYSGKFDDLKKIIEASAKVRSVSTGGLAGKIPSDRYQYLDSLDVLAEQIDYAHSKGLAFEIVLNAPSGIKSQSDKSWWEGAKKYVKELEALKVDGVIVSHPFIIELVKAQTKLKVTVSTVAEIMTARSGLHYERMGADIIVPSLSISMDEIRLMKQSLTKARIRIIVNEGGMPDCPWRIFHYNHCAYSDSDIEYHAHCKKALLLSPHLLLTNCAIRPEDLHYYEGITNEFDIVDRLTPIDQLLIRIKAYSEEKFKGNYVQLINSQLSPYIFIPNEELDGLLQRKLSCSKICDKCNYCRDLFNRIGQRKTKL